MIQPASLMLAHVDVEGTHDRRHDREDHGLIERGYEDGRAQHDHGEVSLGGRLLAGHGLRVGRLVRARLLRRLDIYVRVEVGEDDAAPDVAGPRQGSPAPAISTS